jgi:hypothetical protein
MTFSTLLDSNRDPTDLAYTQKQGRVTKMAFFQNVVAVNPDVGQFVACVLEYFVLDNSDYIYIHIM